MAYPDVVLADGPYAYWRFNDLTDEVGSNDLTPTGTEPLRNGASLVGIEGDVAVHSVVNDQYRWAVDAAEIICKNPMSAEAWLKPAYLPESFRIIHGSNFELKLGNGSGSAGAKLEFNFINVVGDNYRVACATTLVVDSIYHVVATVDGTALKIYINGELDGTATMPSGGAFTLPEASPYVGKWWGDFDEVAYYRVALTPEQIADHYAWGIGEGEEEPPPSSSSGSVGGWAAGDDGQLLVASAAPASSANGHPVDADGKLAIGTGAVVGHVNGLAVNAAGSVITNPGGSVAGWANGWPVDSAGKLCTGSGTPAGYSGGLPLDSSGRVVVA